MRGGRGKRSEHSWPTKIIWSNLRRRKMLSYKFVHAAVKEEAGSTLTRLPKVMSFHKLVMGGGFNNTPRYSGERETLSHLLTSL